MELLSFTAKLNPKNQTDLKWATASELGSDYFMIEKSSDGKHFFDFKKVKAAGNSTSVLNYAAVDEKPFDGYTYYRLREVDFNTDAQYSQIESVFLADKVHSDAFLYPNPAVDLMYLKIIGTAYNEYRIIDAHGKILTESKLTLTEDENVYQIDCSKLASAVYMLLLKGKEKTETIRFVIYSK